MRVIGIRRCSGRYAQQFDIKRMPLVEIMRSRLASQCLGNLLTGAYEAALRRSPRDLVDLIPNAAQSPVLSGRGYKPPTGLALTSFISQQARGILGFT